MPPADPPAPAESSQWYETVVLPALLRAARTTYGTAIRAGLAGAGIDDMPRNGAFLVGAIARNGTPLSEVISDLGLSKQRAGQLVDTLVDRGFLERAPDPEDRRRMTITLTDRGRLAAAAGRTAVEAVDAALIARVGGDAVMHARVTLAALIELDEPAA
jgi:DNA-binding MarR family transcriptional regulator